MLLKIIAEPLLPPDLDIGYRVLLDKDGLAADLKPPNYGAYIPSHPTKAEFLEIIEVFFHEAGGENFQWRWLDEDNQVRGCDQLPPEGYGFQVRVWVNPNDANPPGIRDASAAPACDPGTGIRTHTSGDIKTAPGLQGLEHAEFRWDVAIIELEPPYKATVASEYRSLYY